MALQDEALKRAVDFIKPWEGLCLRAYPDPASPLSKALSARNLLAKYKSGEAAIPADLRALSGAPWTIGYGETQGITEGMVWTLEQAESRLAVRVKGFMQAVLKASPKLSAQAPEALAAVTSLAYNIGSAAYTGSTVAKKIAVEDWQAAAAAFKLWNKAGGQVMDGLVKRRQAESEMFLKAFAVGMNVPNKGEPAPEIIVAEKPAEVQNKGGSMYSKIMALLALFRQGKSVIDPAKWKMRQVSATMIGMVIISAVHVANMFGVNLHGIDDATATTIGGVIIGIVNLVLTFTTSKKVGASAEVAGQEQARASVPEAAGAEQESQSVQHVDSPSVADVIGDVGAWLSKAHADVSNRRAEDETYYST